MKLVPIKVECHSGYKADEYPVCFYLEYIKYAIEEISDRWYQADPSPDLPVADYFKVCTGSNREFLIRHELESDQWYLVIADDRMFGFSNN